MSNVIQKAHKIKLYPTVRQEGLLARSCGVARFAYNWALNKWQEDYKKGIKQSAYSLIKHLNSIKRIEFPWMQETSKTCSQYAIHNLESAYKKMWKEGSAYPKFKKKGIKDSFLAIENKEAFGQKDFKIRIPKIGWIKCAENIRFEGKVNNVSVKRVANNWFAIVNVELPIEIPMVIENQEAVGIDMGIKTMLVLSNGVVYENPKALRSNLRSLKRLQRSLSRKVKGSKNRAKARMLVAKKHYRISCIRSSTINQATSEIVSKYGKLVIETLRPANMMKNKNLSLSVSDVSFGEIARQLNYKAKWAGKEVVKADQWFASSKTCSCCGHKKTELKLSERVYKCDQCGIVMDRDLNAAKNLAKYSPTPKSGGCKACGESSSSSEKKVRGSVKQELNIN